MTQWHVVLFRLVWMQDVTTLRSSILTDLTKQTLTSNLVTWLVPLFSEIALITEMAVEQADAYLNGTAPEEEKQLVPCVAITADNTDCLNAFVYTEPEAK